MILGLVWMGLANGGVFLAARSLLRRVATADPLFNLLAGIVIHFVLLSTTVLAFGLAGLLKAEILGLSGLVVGGALLAAGELRAPAFPWRPAVGRRAGLCLAAIAVVLAIQVWLYSPVAIDALSYHLPKLSAWVQTGSLWTLTGADARESFPAGLELLEAWWVVFLRHDVLIELAGLEFFALGFAAILLLASRLGVPEDGLPWCGVLYLLTPGLHQLSTSAMNDGAVAALVTAVAALVTARGPLWLLAAVVFIGAGVKPTFLTTLPAFAGLAWLQRKEAALQAPGGWIGRALGAAAVFPGVFWYARNLAWYGNPLFPAGDPAHWPAPGAAQVLREAGVRIEALLGPAPLDANEPISFLLVQSAGWGIVAFAVGIPALLLEAREHRPLGRCLAAYLAALLSVALAVHPDFHFLRFVLFFPALLVVAALRWGVRERSVRQVLVAAGALLFFMTLLPHDVGLRGVAERWSVPWSERGRDERLADLPPDAEVAVLRGLNGSSYTLLAPDFRRRLVALGDIPGPEALAAELDRRGIRWIDHRGWPESRRTRDAVTALLKSGGLKRITSDFAERVR